MNLTNEMEAILARTVSSTAQRVNVEFDKHNIQVKHLRDRLRGDTVELRHLAAAIQVATTREHLRFLRGQVANLSADEKKGALKVIDALAKTTGVHA